jgi:hypothetical protein
VLLICLGLLLELELELEEFLGFFFFDRLSEATLTHSHSYLVASCEESLAYRIRSRTYGSSGLEDNNIIHSLILLCMYIIFKLERLNLALECCFFP